MLCKSNQIYMAVYWRSFRCSGVTRLSQDLEEMTGRKANIFFRLCWSVVAPVLIAVSDLSHQSRSDLFLPKLKTNSNVKRRNCPAAGHHDVLGHQFQTSPLWRLRVPSLGPGGRLGHCHVLHHLDSPGCCSHAVEAPWLLHAGNIYFISPHSLHCRW